MKTYTEHHYGDYRDSEKANSIRACGATIGGGSEVLVVEECVTYLHVSDQDVAFPIRSQVGGGQQMIVEVLPFDTTQITSPGNWSKPEWGGAMPSSRSRTASPSGSDKDDQT